MPTRKPVVLVVDDNPTVAKTLAWVLEQSGYLTALAYSGKDAMEMLSGISTDVAVVDVMLPDVDGIKVAVEVCKRSPHCKILLISGYPESARLIERMKADGMNFEVLAKPIQPPDLLGSIARLLS